MRNGGYGGIPKDEEDIWDGFLKSMNEQEEQSCFNKMMTPEEFLEWVKFDDSSSRDEELMETMEFFCCPNTII